MQGDRKKTLGVVAVPEKKIKDDSNRSFWRVNKEMLACKLHFFLFIGGMGAIAPYHSAVGITRFGLTASNLAAAFTSQQITFLLLKPGIGYLADYFNKLKATIIGLTIIQAVCFICMLVTPATDRTSALNNSESQTTSPLQELKLCHLCNHYQEYEMMISESPFDNDIVKQGIYCLENSENKLKNTKLICPSITGKSSVSIDFQIISTSCNISTNSSILSTSYLESTGVTNYFFIKTSVNHSNNIFILCSYTEYGNSNPSNTTNTLKVMKKHCFPLMETKLAFLLVENILSNLSLPSHIFTCKYCNSNNSQQQEVEINMDVSAANFKTYQFWLYTVFLIISCVCISCIFTMSDTVCYEIAQKNGNDYGRQRAWGAISWGLTAPLAGFLNDYTDSYFAAWGLMVIFCSLQIWNLHKMDFIKPNPPQNIRKDLKIVFSSKEFIAFEIGVLMNGIFTGVVWYYLPWFIIVIGGNRLQIGLAHTVQCFFGEVPFMFLSGWFIKKLGHFNVVSLALFSHGVRFLCYSSLKNAWWILPVESLHGLTFGLFYAAMTSYAKLSSKPGLEATNQSVLCTTYEALGAGIGCVISGICFDRYGAQSTYLYLSISCALATCINMLSTFAMKCKRIMQEASKITINCERYCT